MKSVVITSVVVFILFLFDVPVYAQTADKDFLSNINPVTLVIGIAALTTSLFALWHNYLAPFNLKITHTDPIFSLYEFTSVDENDMGWWIPTFSIIFSFYNAGKKSGQVYDLRILATYTPEEKDQKTKTYAFYPIWVVKSDVFESNRERKDWLAHAVTSTWYPMMIPGKEMHHIHLILEAGPWNKIKSGKIKMVLEVRSSQKKQWQRIKEYSMTINKNMFGSKSRYHLFELPRKTFDNMEAHEKNEKTKS